MRFDCNVEVMSRAELETAYFNVVDTAETLLNAKENLSGRIQIALRKELGLCVVNTHPIGTRRDGEILAALMIGRICSTEFLAETVRQPGISKYVCTNQVRVYICGLRKVLPCLGIEIETIRFQGYVMDGLSIKNLQTLINKHNNKDTVQ